MEELESKAFELRALAEAEADTMVETKADALCSLSV